MDSGRPIFRLGFAWQKALVSALSRNFPSKGHAIFWDGKKVHDPSNLKRHD
jgi:hypothetical protein